MTETSFGERFLRDPDGFPRRPEGRTWGDGSLTLAFAGGRYCLEGLAQPQLSLVASRFGDCLEQESLSGAPRHRLRFFRTPVDDFLPEPEEGGTYAFDTDYRNDLVRLAGEAFMARIALTPALDGAVWLAESRALLSHGVLESCLRFMEAYRLLEQGGVLLHCAGVVDRGRAILFLGRSGAGKTTVARMSLTAGRPVLSDDINALMPAGDGLVALNLPFAGDLGGTTTDDATYPVGALCLLRQGPLNVEPASPGVTLGALLGCAPFVNADPHRRERLFGNLEALIRRLPALELTFGKDEDFWVPLQQAVDDLGTDRDGC